jgi:hypothetical protein
MVSMGAIDKVGCTNYLDAAHEYMLLKLYFSKY